MYVNPRHLQRKYEVAEVIFVMASVHYIVVVTMFPK